MPEQIIPCSRSKSITLRASINIIIITKHPRTWRRSSLGLISLTPRYFSSSRRNDSRYSRNLGLVLLLAVMADGWRSTTMRLSLVMTRLVPRLSGEEACAGQLSTPTFLTPWCNCRTESSHLFSVARGNSATMTC